jgi:hypothetical protein
MVVVHPGRNDFALAEPSPHLGGSVAPSHQGSATPPGMELAPTSIGLPLLHTLPSPTCGSPPPDPWPPQSPGSPAGSSLPPDLVWPHRFELRVIPHTPVIDEAEAALANALTVMAGGTRPLLSPEQVQDHLSRFFAIGEGEVQDKRYNRADFLLVFANRQLADRVLHVPPLPQASISLSFHCWNRQAGALFKPFRFKIPLSVTNVPAHVWSVETVQEIVASSCLVSEVSSCSLDQSDQSLMVHLRQRLHQLVVSIAAICRWQGLVILFVSRWVPRSGSHGWAQHAQLAHLGSSTRKGGSVWWQEAGWDGRTARVSRCMSGAGLPCTVNQ